MQKKVIETKMAASPNVQSAISGYESKAIQEAKQG